MANDILKQRYPNINAKGFIELAVQIQQLYDGPWVIVGNCPEEGCYNPNPQDQARARNKWRKAYRMLMPYEDLIEREFSILDTLVSSYWSDDEAKQAVRAMWDICCKYHNVVELWDMTEGDDEPAPKKEVKEDAPKAESYFEKMKKARDYFNASHAFFMSDIFPTEKKNTVRWVKSISEDKRDEEIKKRKDSLRTALCNSGFLNGYPVSRKDVEENMMCLGFSSVMEQDEFYQSVCFGLAFKDIFDNIGVLNIDKVAAHLYDHRADIHPAATGAFFKFIELTKVLNGYLSAQAEKETFIANITADIFDEEIWEEPKNEEPTDVPYNMNKAIDYFSEKENRFNSEIMPRLKESTGRWWKRIPNEKREDAINNRLEEYEKELKVSCFLQYYMADLTPGFIEEILPCADNGEQAQRMLEDEQFACDMYDLHDGIDVLNYEKVERYIWVNQKRLSDSQIFAFLTYVEMKEYLPTLIEGEVSKPEEQHVGTASEGHVEKPILGTVFSPALYKNIEASMALIKLVKEKLNPSLCTGKRTDKWSWGHVQEAFKQVGFVEANCDNAAFGRAMVEINGEQLKADNVKAACHRYSVKAKANSDKNLIANLVSELTSIKNMLKG